MGFIDIVLGALLVFGLIRGLRNGLIVEFASLISFFLGIYLAVKFSSVFGESKTAKVTAFIIILIAVIIGIHLVAKALSKIANAMLLGGLNKIGGAIFGTLRTALFLGVILSLFQKVNRNDTLVSKETETKSLFFNPILKTSELMLPVLSSWFTNMKKKV
ncbi:CvpA family protein [Flavobacterium sp.]|uniref:CvpA family protein n=1 Tax=Flavobacterium sp. TaxID=239 RepID=UPI003BE7A4EB